MHRWIAQQSFVLCRSDRPSSGRYVLAGEGDHATYRYRFPSGRKYGTAWPVSCFESSRTVMGRLSPPAEVVRFRTPADENRMTPSAFQVPPARFGALQIICTEPPVTPIFLIRPPEKKAISRLSGDQKGEEAPSVPINSSGLVDSKRLRKMRSRRRWRR